MRHFLAEKTYRPGLGNFKRKKADRRSAAGTLANDLYRGSAATSSVVRVDQGPSALRVWKRPRISDASFELATLHRVGKVAGSCPRSPAAARSRCSLGCRWMPASSPSPRSVSVLDIWVTGIAKLAALV